MKKGIFLILNLLPLLAGAQTPVSDSAADTGEGCFVAILLIFIVVGLVIIIMAGRYMRRLTTNKSA